MDFGNKDRQHWRTTEMSFATVGRKFVQPNRDSLKDVPYLTGEGYSIFCHQPSGLV